MEIYTRFSLYRTLEDFDAYICCVGRVQVAKSAEYELQKDCTGTIWVYFLNSKNYLPTEAVSIFLKTKHEEFSSDIS